MASWSVSYTFFSISHKSHSSEIWHTFDTFCNSSPKSFHGQSWILTTSVKWFDSNLYRIDYTNSVALSLVHPKDTQINASWICIKFIFNDKWNCFYLGSFLGSPFFEMMNGLKYATYDRQNMLRVKWLQTYNRCWILNYYSQLVISELQ